MSTPYTNDLHHDWELAKKLVEEVGMLYTHAHCLTMFTEVRTMKREDPRSYIALARENGFSALQSGTA